MDRQSLIERWKLHRKWPRTTLGRLAAILTILAVPFYLLGRISKIQAAGWYSTTFTFVLWCLGTVLVLLGFRWLRQNLMWRLRNRLIVTYVFIGVIPVVLLVLMAGIAGYLFAGQFATFIVTSDISSDLGRLEALNGMIAADLAARPNPAAAVQEAVRIGGQHLQGQFPGRSVTVRIGDSTITSPDAAKPLVIPDFVRKESAFRSLVLGDDNRIYLRAAGTLNSDGRTLTVLSSVPLTKELLLNIIQGVGVVTVQPPDRGAAQPATTTKPRNLAQPDKKTGKVEKTPPKETVTFRFGGQQDGSVVTFQGDKNTESSRVEAGVLSPKRNRFDFELTFGTALAVRNWETGETRRGLLVVQTRPSILYERLFRTLGDFSGVILSVLIGIGILFGFIELVALFIGVRLTRTMTASVAQLYDATQHIETGELSHRIPVRREDQLAALERSFNSMTESLQKLIAEQKEKQRIESELAIAHEVQSLLFPRDISSVEGFEVHGICRPARTVSGDYYDFLPMGPNLLGVAVGDISGKGISAALLMATVHAFVRAYTLVESVPALAAVGAGAQSENALVRMSSPGVGDLPPGTLLAMLNHQLYRSTPTEKYATMFLGVYDARTRNFKYSNAGHLPPIIISNDGTTRALDTGGLVVGLFGDVTYPDDSVQMASGDIFLAYSDGVTEPENEFGEFGEERLIALVQENRHLPLDRISDIVVAAVTDWIGGNEQPDDITLVLARAQ